MLVASANRFLLIFIIWTSRISASVVKRPSEKNPLADYVEPRIINGNQVTDRTQFGWMGRIRCFDFVYTALRPCGATLINLNYLLTAVPCVTYPSSDGTFVKSSSCAMQFGGLTSTGGDETGQELFGSISSGSDIIFDPQGVIALVKLPPSITQSDYIYPITLAADTTADYAGQEVTIVGWGYTETEDSEQVNLRQAKSWIRSTCQCDWFLNCPQQNKASFNEVYMTCFGGLGTTVTTAHCFIDTGGPVVLGSGRTAVLVGVMGLPTDQDQSAYCSERAALTNTCDLTSTTTTTSSVPTTTSVPTTAKSSKAKVLLESFLRRFFLGRESRQDTGSPSAANFAAGQLRPVIPRQVPAPASCSVNSPGVASKVASFKDWIDANAV